MQAALQEGTGREVQLGQELAGLHSSHASLQAQHASLQSQQQEHPPHTGKVCADTRHLASSPAATVDAPICQIPQQVALPAASLGSAPGDQGTSAYGDNLTMPNSAAEDSILLESELASRVKGSTLAHGQKERRQLSSGQLQMEQQSGVDEAAAKVDEAEAVTVGEQEAGSSPLVPKVSKIPAGQASPEQAPSSRLRQLRAQKTKDRADSPAPSCPDSARSTVCHPPRWFYSQRSSLFVQLTTNLRLALSDN